MLHYLRVKAIACFRKRQGARKAEEKRACQGCSLPSSVGAVLSLRVRAASVEPRLSRLALALKAERDLGFDVVQTRQDEDTRRCRAA